MVSKYSRFSESEDQFIRDNYLTMSHIKIASQLGRSKFGVYNRIRLLGLNIPAELKEKRKKSTQFKPGNIPANKGKKGYCAPGCEKGWFKKGHLPPNTKHDGAITIRHGHKDRGEKPYLYIRISLGKWEPLHRFVWRRHNGGAIPKGYNVVFKDGNTFNCNIENLELVTDGDLVKRNSNREKAAATNRATRRKFKDLEKDEFIIKLISRDEEIRQLLRKRPDIIEMKRNQLKLNRSIKYASER